MRRWGHSRISAHRVRRVTCPASLPSRTSSTGRSPMSRTSWSTLPSSRVSRASRLPDRPPWRVPDMPNAPAPAAGSVACCRNNAAGAEASCRSETHRVGTPFSERSACATARARCVLPTPPNPVMALMRSYSLTTRRRTVSTSHSRPCNGRATAVGDMVSESNIASPASHPAARSNETRSCAVSRRASARSRTVSRRGTATCPCSRFRTARTLTMDSPESSVWVSRVRSRNFRSCCPNSSPLTATTIEIAP